MSQERLDQSLNIDQMPARDVVRLILEQDALVPAAVAAQADHITRAIEQIVERLSHGGKLVYVGAGTSGRIAMLDAAELPPTYGVPSTLVSVMLAGGANAFLNAAEGAEDDEEAGIAEVNQRVTADDAVVGIAASGTTPYTVAAIRRANMIGALTVAVSSVAGSPLAAEADIAITPQTGPEVIMGSSRMKSGTAQKLVLNAISTGVMIRLGKVYSNLMTEMPATNEKLRSRAVRMVELVSGAPRPIAAQAFRDAGGEVKVASVMARRRVGAEEARALLARHAGSLREALES